MDIVANVLVVVVAVLHLLFAVLQAFLWQGPRARALSGFDAGTARATAPLAANQGLYNAFVAAGLLWGLLRVAERGHAVLVFFLAFVVIAGVVGGLTARRTILLTQALPGAVALTAVLSAH
ncbi:DUF1304 domain-containing protein [Streptomyces sp. NPDC094143]|uniref:DUF1304 domain-containing protein n=1 Tax=Streptomyces sp. NPDC094143 TaxID=3155310 RepID=UPI00332669BC